MDADKEFDVAHGIHHSGSQMPSASSAVGTMERTVLWLERSLSSAGLVVMLGWGTYKAALASRAHALMEGPQQALVNPPAWRVLGEKFGSVGFDTRIEIQWPSYVKGILPLSVLCAVIAVATQYTRQRWRGRRCPDVLALLYMGVGLALVTCLHGPYFIFLPLCLTASYFIFTPLRGRLPRSLFLCALWTFQLGLLYVVVETEGFERFYWLQYYVPSHREVSKFVVGVEREPAWPRLISWSSALRLSTLRMIAYHYDELEAGTADSAAAATARAVRKHDTSCVECALLREAHGARGDDSVRCYKYRTERPRDASEYGYVRYMAYMLFPPLYIGGPISSYNAFASHLLTASRAMPVRSMAVYALRIAFVWLLTFLLLHYVYVCTFMARDHIFASLTLSEQAYVMFLFLAFLWMKFTFIWRTSRLFALWCGVDVPENMPRCYADLVSVRGFWRDWHASFNLWIVRYMYIPMGGRSHQLLAVVPIFFFVALWHDHTLSLLKWAFFLVLLFVLETLVSGAFERASCAVSAALAELDAHDGECVRRGVAARVARCLHHLPASVRHHGHYLVRVLGTDVIMVGMGAVNVLGFSRQGLSLDRHLARLAGRELTATGSSSHTSDGAAAQTQPVQTFLPGVLFFLFMCAIVSTQRQDRDRAVRESDALRLGMSQHS